MARTPDEPRAAAGTLRAVTATVVAASAVPYGYTLAIWGSGAVLLRSLGAPTAAEAFIFAAGASAGFYLVDWLLGLLAWVTSGPVNPINRYEDRALAGAFDLIAVGVALGAVSPLDGGSGHASGRSADVTGRIVVVVPRHELRTSAFLAPRA